jgi:hypothetical protein
MWFSRSGLKDEDEAKEKEARRTGYPRPRVRPANPGRSFCVNALLVEANFILGYEN